jgi:hypothetical protein
MSLTFVQRLAYLMKNCRTHAKFAIGAPVPRFSILSAAYWRQD